jgi:hypothetical protein
MLTIDDPWGIDTGSAGPVGRLTDVLLDGLLKIHGSFLLFIAAVSVILVILGLVWSESVLAGMFGIRKRNALAYAGLGFVFLRLTGYH